MRPEYIEAVNAVRYGWSFWAWLLVPVGVVWICARARSHRMLLGCTGFVIACIVCYGLGVYHSNRIQDTKGLTMQTEEERADWTADTGNALAPVTMMPMAMVYCSIIAAVAYGAPWLRTYLSRHLVPPAP